MISWFRYKFINKYIFLFTTMAIWKKNIKFKMILFILLYIQRKIVTYILCYLFVFSVHFNQKCQINNPFSLFFKKLFWFNTI